ncbi:DoxX family protein [Staphylococcus massiliensis]|uniref:DoxX family protein n=1 Tax=Staphylococcus massiliensis TaxID=555791 RepID=UPI001EDFEEC4|nr:DoxX family protein [Staphylococcus massiliensis]MCG3412787.1 DoxX family protein [Staphylococcus massiliensis]
MLKAAKIVQSIVAFFFVIVSFNLMKGNMDQDFDDFGYPDGFSKLTGVFELLGAIGLIVGLWKRVFGYLANLLILGTMIVASLSHIFLAKDSILRCIPSFGISLINFWLLFENDEK